MRKGRLALVLGPFLCACAPGADAGEEAISAVCQVVGAQAALPAAIDESSGLARASTADLLWTHNDSGGEPELYAIRPDGRLVATVRLRGARNRDWEDLAAGPCDAGRCLFVGDFGDNEATREDVAIYVIAEPDPSASEVADVRRLAFTYPGGPRDAEALFMVGDGTLHVISKGRTSNIALYRYPPPLRPDETVQLEHVADLTRRPAELPEQVTAADASPDGEWVALRTYAALVLYRTRDLLAGRPATSVVDLAALGEPQGEAVSIDDAGVITLTSEASGDSGLGTITVLRCEVGGAGS